MKKPRYLIAECGNNHLGSMENARCLILAAKECGANLVKFQAIDKDHCKGSMPAEFYQRCALSLSQYSELIHYGRSNDIDVFFSIFSDKMNDLKLVQNFHKLSAGQTEKDIEKNGQATDEPNTFVSFKEGKLFYASKLVYSFPLYATEYNAEDPRLTNLIYLEKIAHVPFGFSDHYIGPMASILAIKEFGCSVIEKHFTIQKNIPFNGVVFRDTVHGADQKEFEEIAKEFWR